MEGAIAKVAAGSGQAVTGIGAFGVAVDATIPKIRNDVDALELLVDSLDLSAAEMEVLSGMLKQQPEQFDISAESADALAASLDEQAAATREVEDAQKRNTAETGRLQAAADKLAPKIDDVADAQEDLEDHTDDATEALQEQNNQMRVNTDPAFALLDATQRQAEAQKTLNELIAKGITDGPEYVSAVDDLADAFLDGNQAMIDIKATGGKWETQLGELLTALGLDVDKVQEFIDLIKELNTLSPVPAPAPSPFDGDPKENIPVGTSSTESDLFAPVDRTGQLASQTMDGGTITHITQIMLDGKVLAESIRDFDRSLI
jgi:hypothetical protein